MDAIQAIKLLMQRNQSLVNKKGETTRYTRETDEIINALIPVVKRDAAHKDMRRKVQMCGSIMGIPNLLDCIDTVPVEFFDFISKSDYQQFTDSLGCIQDFCVENLPVYIGQIKEAYIGYIIRKNGLYELIEQNNEIISQSDDLEYIDFLRKINHDLFSELRDLV